MRQLTIKNVKWQYLYQKLLLALMRNTSRNNINDIFHNAIKNSIIRTSFLEFTHTIAIKSFIHGRHIGRMRGKNVIKKNKHIDSHLDAYTSSSKSAKAFVWRLAAASTVIFPARRTFSPRLFVSSSHRVLTLAATTVGVATIIYRQPSVIYASAEWTRPVYTEERLVVS